jgi:hypothetical protein
LYILWHEGYQAWKFGITNLGTTHDRVAIFGTHGWQAIRMIQYESGETARVAENKIKAWAKGQGFEPAVDVSDMPAGGWTETIRSSDVDEADVIIAIAKMR